MSSKGRNSFEDIFMRCYRNLASSVITYAIKKFWC